MSVWVLVRGGDGGACFSRFVGVRGRHDDRLSRLMPVRPKRDCRCVWLRLRNVTSRNTRPATGHRLDGEIIVLLVVATLGISAVAVWWF